MVLGILLIHAVPPDSEALLPGFSNSYAYGDQEDK